MPDNTMRETEIKLHTPDLAAVQAALESAGATLTKPRVYERNLRYEDADETLTSTRNRAAVAPGRGNETDIQSGRVLRDGIVSRFEAEVQVSDFETMDVILRRLGFHVALIYEKYRTTYELMGAEVVLDELPYGNFTEIEGDADTIERVVAALGLGECRRMEGSYTDIFAEVKARLGLDARDLTFEAFDGLQDHDIDF